jgi:hypothetical protein
MADRIKTFAIAEAIHAAFLKAPEQIKREGIKQEILQQDDMPKEVSSCESQN